MDRINDIFNQRPRITAPNNPVTLHDYSVHIRNLTVSYQNRTVLNNINLTLPQGRTVALVGPIGCGKSTLLKALLRLIETPHHSVFIGEQDTSQMPLQQLRGVVGYVPQNPLLFSKSLKMNIAFGQPTASHEAILKALEDACLTTDLAALPEGIETAVGERGITLSGGQKQRAAIARALLLHTPILVLDDALSAVDTHTEKHVITHIRNTRAQLTTCWVTHRISTAQHADIIYVLNDGCIVEQGNHASLLQQEGLYAHMAQQQSTEKTA
jgi:ATP-binding cassette subfamily B protein